MPKETTNYGLKKPLYSDNADIAILNENFDQIDQAMTPSISAVDEPTSEGKGKLQIVLGWLANRLKAITGLPSWQSSPSVTLEDCAQHMQAGKHSAATKTSDGFMSQADKTKLDNASNLANSNTLIMRDSNGRAKIKSPASADDIVNKEYVDDNFVKKNASTTMSATLTAYSNTAYTTKQVRNIVFWTSGSTPPATNNGDVIIKTF